VSTPTLDPIQISLQCVTGLYTGNKAAGV